MVYRRSSRRKSAYRPRSAKSRYGRKRTGFTRRRVSRRVRPMSTRVLLNKTSQKKRDNMLSYTNTTAADPFSTTYTGTGAVMRFPVGQTNPGSEFFYVWNATARPAETSEGQRGSKIDVSLRTSESIYAKGLRERITLETNNSAPWEWRRVCFTSKDDFGQTDPDTATFFRQTSSGMVRMLSALSTGIYLQSELFEGERNQDWLSVFTAPLSRKNFSIKYDKTRIIRSTNNSGTIREYKLWHPMESNLAYREEQQGETMTESAVSVTGRVGMGNYYVIDMFRKHGNNDDQSTLTFTPEATFFWHEK
uniref:Capsid protein n=1 Tax=Grus monacha Genomoviridae sp. TaxID=2814962 RepID=A0A8A4XD55_9VIRU|nr:MAG: capsid protein [Gemykibivirus]